MLGCVPLPPTFVATVLLADDDASASIVAMHRRSVLQLLSSASSRCSPHRQGWTQPAGSTTSSLLLAGRRCAAPSCSCGCGASLATSCRRYSSLSPEAEAAIRPSIAAAAGGAHKKKAPNVQEFSIYRWSPEHPDKPHMQTYKVRLFEKLTTTQLTSSPPLN